MKSGRREAEQIMDRLDRVPGGKPIRREVDVPAHGDVRGEGEERMISVESIILTI